MSGKQRYKLVLKHSAGDTGTPRILRLLPPPGESRGHVPCPSIIVASFHHATGERCNTSFSYQVEKLLSDGVSQAADMGMVARSTLEKFPARGKPESEL